MIYDLAELQRRLANLIRPGKIESVDYATATARVTIGPLRTAPLPWLTARAGDDRTWWAPSVGEQVLVLSPSGELAAGWILPGAYTQAAPAPANAGTIDRTVYADGTVVEYDKAAHRLRATLQGTLLEATRSKVTVTATNVEINGTTTINGQTTINGVTQINGNTTIAGAFAQGGAGATMDGPVTVTQDVTAAGISLETHKHDGVQAGGSLTGLPQ